MPTLTVMGGSWLPASASTSGSTATDSTPTANAFDGVPAVGAVFLDGLDAGHSCTGSVIRSSGRSVVLTSAHCLSGTGQGVLFVPGYHEGQGPYGSWDVVAAYVDPRWVSAQDPQHDYAFLALAPQQHRGRTVRLGDVVIGQQLGTAVQPGQRVQVVAYPAGINDKPITCTTTTYVYAGFPAFDCHGFVGGTSGAPWLSDVRGHDTVVRGIIGGLHQGGCFEYTSYSPSFDQDTFTVFQRAVHGLAANTLPAPGSDGC